MNDYWTPLAILLGSSLLAALAWAGRLRRRLTVARRLTAAAEDRASIAEGLAAWRGQLLDRERGHRRDREPRIADTRPKV